MLNVTPRWERVLLLALFCLPLTFASTTTVLGQELERRILAEGTPHETEYFIQRADEPGPTVLIVGGVHGNEPAGVHAVEVVRYWPIERGTVISVPSSNVTALAADSRQIPGAPKGRSNLNRLFPKPDAEEVPDTVEHPLADALWQLMKSHQPDWVFDCHEGYDFHQINSKSVGSTVIADKKAATQKLAEVLLDVVNADIETPEKTFVKRGPPIAGSLARAASDHLDAQAMILESTKKDQRIPFRARQHRQMLHAALTELDMLSPDVTPYTLLTDLCDEGTIHVGIYDDGGVGGTGRMRVEEQAADWPVIRTVRFDGQDIRSGACEGFDVLVFSGGSGGGQANSLGEDGKERVVQFVENGGVYIGICAGAYLACSDGPQYGLGLVNVRTKSSKWRRGKTDVVVEITPAGAETFALDGPTEMPIRYANGPIWQPADNDELPEAEVLGWYRTEIAENDTPEGIMVDSPALIRGPYGNGVAYAFSCHPEQTDESAEFVVRAILAARSLEPALAGE